jgi:hypothetical protein
MHKLLPFRQYDEKDVVNLFKLALGSTNLSSLVPGGTATGAFTDKEFWSGTVVKPATSNDWTGSDPSGLHGTATNNAPYLGAIGSGDQGYSPQWGSIYPEAPMSVEVAGASDTSILGISLRPTLAYDENGEKLLYYSVKKDELQCLIPGETVPIATRGFFTFSSDSGLDGSSDGPGDELRPNANGNLAGGTPASGSPSCGLILASGTRDGAANPNVFFSMFNSAGGRAL